MADLVITAANVIKGAGAGVSNGIAGENIVAGQVVYEDTADANKIKLADANGSSLTATQKGIALHGALTGQPIAYQQSGQITLGAVLTAGKAYVLSATPGGIAPIADLTTGWRTSLTGIALTTSSLMMTLINSDTLNA